MKNTTLEKHKSKCGRYCLKRFARSGDIWQFQWWDEEIKKYCRKSTRRPNLEYAWKVGDRFLRNCLDVRSNRTLAEKQEIRKQRSNLKAWSSGKSIIIEFDKPEQSDIDIDNSGIVYAIFGKSPTYGICKVGMTTNPPRRLRKHFSDFQTFGYSVDGFIVSEYHESYKDSETKLINNMKTVGRFPQTNRGEYFEIDYTTKDLDVWAKSNLWSSLKVIENMIRGLNVGGRKVRLSVDKNNINETITGLY